MAGLVWIVFSFPWGTVILEKSFNFSDFIYCLIFKIIYVTVYVGQTCGTKLTGSTGTFSTPNFPNYYPPNIVCDWEIEASFPHEQSIQSFNIPVFLCAYLSVFLKVPINKVVKVTFKKLLLAEPGQENGKNCYKDYVMIDRNKK